MEKVKIMSVLELFRDRTIRGQVYLMVVLVLMVSLNGVTTIHSYSFDVFRTAGLDEELMPYLILGVGACDLGPTLFCFCVVEHFGRRKLLLWGYGLMVLLLVLLTASFSLRDHAFWLPYCNVALIFLVLIAFGAGPARETLLIRVEIFMQSSRASALVVTSILLRAGQYLVGLIFPHLVYYLNTFCLLVYLGITAVTWGVIFRFLPEIKGKPLMDIQREFDRFNGRKRTPAEHSTEGLSNCTRL